MEAKIPGDPVSQVIYVDYTSIHYGHLDGYSFCKDSYEFVLEPENMPLWVTVVDNIVTIGYNTDIDPTVQQEITVNVMKDGANLITPREFVV